MSIRNSILMLLDFTGINKVFQLFNSNKAIILWYHGICDDNFKLLKGYDERHIPKTLFRKQLLYLINNGYQFVTMSTLVVLLKEKKKLNKVVTLTFDDGFLNVIENAYPMMKELSAKGCIYLVSSLMSEKKLLWTDFIEVAVRNNKLKKLQFVFKEKTIEYSLDTKEYCEHAIKDIKAKLRTIPDMERKEHLKQFSIEEVDFQAIPKEFLMANWDQIRGLDKDTLEAGSHTINHPNCANLVLEEEFESELKGAKTDIEAQVGYSIDHFCYPAGSYNNRVIEHVKKYGYQSATTIIPGFNDSTTPIYELQRIPTDENLWLFKAMVSGSFLFISDMLQVVKGKK